MCICDPVRVDAGDTEFVVLVTRDIRLEEREVVGISRHQRQVPDFSLADGPAEVDLSRLRDGRLTGHGDRFRHAANAERDIHDSGLACRQRQPLLFELLETLELGRDAVRPERKQRSAIDARLVA